MIGKTISHYKILEKLGEGGMGSLKAQARTLRPLGEYGAIRGGSGGVVWK